MTVYIVSVSLLFLAALILVVVLFRKLQNERKKLQKAQESRPEPVPEASKRNIDPVKTDGNNANSSVAAVRLPTEHSASAAERTHPAPVEHKQSAAHYSHEGRALEGARVLAVEDNVMNLTIVEDILEGNGCIVTTAANGRIALETFEASAPGSFDLILMDIMMPEMNGLEATKAIRALDRSDAKKIPVIALTANAFAEDIAASVAAGMDAHLIKPIDVPELIGTLSSYYHRK